MKHNYFRYALACVVAAMPTLSVAQSAEQLERFEQLSELYAGADLIGEPKLVDCVLSGGEQSFCISLTTGPAPSNHLTGPYCPATIESSPEDSGTWFFNDEVVDADGAFIESLAVLFQDDVWQMYEPATQTAHQSMKTIVLNVLFHTLLRTRLKPMLSRLFLCRRQTAAVHVSARNQVLG